MAHFSFSITLLQYHVIIFCQGMVLFINCVLVCNKETGVQPGVRLCVCVCVPVGPHEPPPPRQHAGLLPESLIWAYIVQLSSALRTIHTAGLACRVMDPSKILITGKTRYTCARTHARAHMHDLGPPASTLTLITFILQLVLKLIYLPSII